MFNPKPLIPHRSNRHGHATRSRSRGISLIELMVGLTLGLMVILTAIGTLMVSRGASASVSDISQLQQQASYALRVIGQQLRQAGAIEPAMDSATQLFSFATTYTGYGTTTAAVRGTDDASGVKLSTSTTRAPLLQNTQSRNCLGDNVTKGNIEATFWQDGNELKCAPLPLATSGQALIQNVADFQVNYRVLNGANSQVLDANQVEAKALWASVKAVEVCIDMQGSERLPDAGTNYTDCKGVSKPRNGFIHLVYRNVFDLRVAGGA